MTRKSLSDHPKTKLEQLARRKGIPGWHAMRKDELIAALSPPKAKTPGRKNTRTSGAAKNGASKNGKHPKAAKTKSRGAKRQSVLAQRDLSLGSNGHHSKDRIVMTVRDPYWLHAYWEISRAAIGRAEAALGQEWHTARPVLRLMDVSSEDTTSSSECHVRDIDIHPGINNWYIDVMEPRRSYRVDIGYITRSERFFGIARSNVVKTPRLGSNDNGDSAGMGLPEDFRRLYETTGADDHAELRELFEERLGKQTVTLAASHFGSGASGHQRQRKFWFQVDAELVVCGSTQPGSRVSLHGENVTVQPDGSFTMRFKLPDSRQIIPATAKSPDGIEERTIVLAVERNTKSLEPMIHDGYE